MYPQPPQGAPPPLDLDVLLVAMLLGVLVMLGMLLAGGGRWLGYYTVHLWLPMWLLACAASGGARLKGRPDWMRRWLRVMRGQFVEYGGGFYGAVALIAFAWLEWGQFRELYDWIVQTDWYTDKHGVREIVRDAGRNIVDFFIGSFMNGISAMVWPAFHAKAFEMRDFWPALGISAGVFAVAQATMKRLPAPARA